MKIVCRPIIKKLIKLVNRTLDSANMDKKEIKAVLLIGGSIGFPSVQEELEKIFLPYRV